MTTIKLPAHQLTNSSGAITYSANYAPYGSPLEQFGTGTTNLGFTGEYTDPSGLLYLRAHYVNLSISSFLTRRFGIDKLELLCYNTSPKIISLRAQRRVFYSKYGGSRGYQNNGDFFLDAPVRQPRGLVGHRCPSCAAESSNHARFQETPCASTPVRYPRVVVGQHPPHRAAQYMSIFAAQPRSRVNQRSK